jgi:hypothetical protein
MQALQLVVVDAVYAADVPGKVDDDRILAYVVGFEIDLGLELSFQAEYGQISVEPARIVQYVQYLGVADFRYEEIIRQSVSYGTGEVFWQIVKIDFVKIAVHISDSFLLQIYYKIVNKFTNSTF